MHPSLARRSSSWLLALILASPGAALLQGRVGFAGEDRGPGGPPGHAARARAMRLEAEARRLHVVARTLGEIALLVEGDSEPWTQALDQALGQPSELFSPRRLDVLRRRLGASVVVGVRQGREAADRAGARLAALRRPDRVLIAEHALVGLVTDACSASPGPERSEARASFLASIGSEDVRTLLGRWQEQAGGWSDLEGIAQGHAIVPILHPLLSRLPVGDRATLREAAVSTSAYHALLTHFEHAELSADLAELDRVRADSLRALGAAAESDARVRGRSLVALLHALVMRSATIAPAAEALHALQVLDASREPEVQTAQLMLRAVLFSSDDVLGAYLRDARGPRGVLDAWAPYVVLHAAFDEGGIEAAQRSARAMLAEPGTWLGARFNILGWLSAKERGGIPDDMGPVFADVLRAYAQEEAVGMFRYLLESTHEAALGSRALDECLEELAALATLDREAHQAVVAAIEERRRRR